MSGIRSSRSVLERFEDKFIPEPMSGCWLWIGATTRKGYGYLDDSEALLKEWCKLAHRRSWEIYVGRFDLELKVLHKCDNRLCVNPDHLFLGTYDDNNKERERKGRGRQPRGSGSGMAKLNEDSVAKILRRGRESQVALAKEFGVDQTLISLIFQRRIWKHVAGPELIKVRDPRDGRRVYYIDKIVEYGE